MQSARPRTRSERARIDANPVALLVFGIAALAAPARASDAASTPTVDPSSAVYQPNTILTFDVPKLAQAIRIDGRLDDPVWQTATKLTGFVEIDPGDNIRPQADTEAMLAYDDENLYIGFLCNDPNPSAIRANVTDRDAMFGDDFAGVMIDTFKDQQNGYEFFVNPCGIQGDLRRNRNNEDSSYDAVWYSGGQVTHGGWTAEMAIPFRSIRFPDQDLQSWGIHVFRNRPRASREQMSWAPISRDNDCFFCQAGTMSGIAGVNQGKNLEVLPYVLASQASALDGSDDATFDWTDDDAAGEAGVGVKYGVTPNHTLDFTYNPDFSQIESDATQIDANRTFALFYPEKRPFFLEGADMFDSNMDIVYTRSINDPELAGKFTGKNGRNTVAFMSAWDETSPYIVPFEEQSLAAAGTNTYSNILRLKRDVLTESYLGLMATDRREADGDGSNTTLGGDALIRFNDNFRVNAQMMGSYTHEPDDSLMSADFPEIDFGSDDQYDSFFNGEEFAGFGAEVDVVRSGRHYNANLWYDDYSPTFRAESGFVTQNNYRMLGFWNGYQFQLEKNPLFERIEPQLEGGRKYNYAGEFKDTWLSPSIWLRFKKQTYFWTGYLWSEEVFAGTRINGIRRWSWDIDTSFSKYLSAGMYSRLGHSVVRDRDDPRLGDEWSYGVYFNTKPLSQLRFDIAYDSFRLDELDGGPRIFDTFVSRAKLTYQFSSKLFFRVIGEYVDDSQAFALDPLLSYKINPFTVFFLGSSHSFGNYEDDPLTTPIEVAQPGYKQTERLFFVKFQYLFRV
ncbi:MAG: carbohydrate binding family 9 domain-containing protein [Candidatus Latescibacteria bacterium]|nr:carbohydrate binding family 9 domain-containing protein [Candidatus Latescibacterota bacterium]